jgi:hypothetical protein
MMATPIVSFVPIVLVVLQEVRNSRFELAESLTGSVLVCRGFVQLSFRNHNWLPSGPDESKEWLLYLWVFSPAINLLGHIVVMSPAGTT